MYLDDHKMDSYELVMSFSCNGMHLKKHSGENINQICTMAFFDPYCWWQKARITLGCIKNPVNNGIKRIEYTQMKPDFHQGLVARVLWRS